MHLLFIIDGQLRLSSPHGLCMICMKIVSYKRKLLATCYFSEMLEVNANVVGPVFES